VRKSGYGRFMKNLSVLIAAPWLVSSAWAEEPDFDRLVGMAQIVAPWDPSEGECGSPDEATIESPLFEYDTVALRQNPCIDPEANVLYLLIGGERSLLIDTGAVTGKPAAVTVDFVELYLSRRGAGAKPLLIAHTHGHQDHRAGDAAFAKLPNTQIVPIESGPLQEFFGFKGWPNDIVQLDLGNRIVDLIPTPGHHQDHIVFYDRNTRLLFSGDFLLPGRLLVEDIDAYRASAARVVEFARTHPVSHVLGSHIELDASGNAYPQGSTWHPNERALPLSEADLLALPQALEDFNGFYSRHPNYIVVNPMHNLVALAAGAVLVIVLLVWVARRLWKRRRAQI
jgi:hydroxyacylglutathione hydrolase